MAVRVICSSRSRAFGIEYIRGIDPRRIGFLVPFASASIHSGTQAGTNGARGVIHLAKDTEEGEVIVVARHGKIITIANTNLPGCIPSQSQFRIRVCREFGKSIPWHKSKSDRHPIARALNRDAVHSMCREIPTMPRTSFTSFASLRNVSAAHFARIGVARAEKLFPPMSPGFARYELPLGCSSISKAKGMRRGGHGHRKGCDVQVTLQFQGFSGAVGIWKRLRNSWADGLLPVHVLLGSSGLAYSRQLFAALPFFAPLETSSSEKAVFRRCFSAALRLLTRSRQYAF